MDFTNTPPKWDAQGTEPTAELQEKGFTAGYKPPAAYFNYLFNKIVACIKEVQTILTNFDNTRRIKTYVSFAEIGQTIGKETIAGIAENMPSNSELFAGVGADNANIYPQTYGILHVYKKDSNRTIFKFYNKSTAYEYIGVYDSSTTSKWSGWKYSLLQSDVIDNLTSTSTNMPLSAKQGKVLNDNQTSHIANTDNPHSVTKSQVGLGNVPNVSTNDQTPTYSDTTTLATLSSGEKLNVAFQKIKYAITCLINHINTHKLITYTSLNDIGLTTGSETIANIANKMAENSELNLVVGADNASIYPQQYGLLKVIKKNTSRTIFKFYNKALAYEYLGIYDDSTSSKWSGWKYTLGDTDVVDNLTSTANKLPLSAKQGKVLYDMLGGHKIVTLSEAEYNALATKDSNTLYFTY